MASSGTCLPPPLAPTLHGMATDQLALTKTNRVQVPASTRQAVPAFLNKLYNMVSNPETDELVRWSEEGDSFYIPSHERLSKELLPRFFKHGNFSSFVRQLNMYGFHKVPHLQQGVLQNSTESELWQFQNPHFQRGQPDLLCLITRKKTGGNPDGATGDDTQHTSHAVGPSSGTQSSGPLDMTLLTSSLAAIKKHQTSLSAELKSLQDSNQHLWNEALAARDRHKKHQDTINKILKFLASVFGNGATAATASGPGGSSSGGRDGRASPGALVPRKRPRLMIENGVADDQDFIHFDASPEPSVQDDHEMSEGRISEAPESAPSPAALAVNPKAEPPPTPALHSIPPTPATQAPQASLTQASLTADAIPASTVARRASANGSTPHHDSTPATPNDSQPQPLFNQSDEQTQEQMYQDTISKLLSSPTTFQRILASLSSQGPDPSLCPAPDSQSELAPYYGGMNMAMDAPDPTIAYGAARLDRATDVLGAQVDNIDHDINAIMSELGFTQDMLQDHPVDAMYGLAPNGFTNEGGTLGFGTNGNDQSVPYASIAPEGDQVDLDSFLNQFEFDPTHIDACDPASATTQHFPGPLPAEFDLENPGAQSAAFLDEVHPIPSAASDTSLSPAIPLLDDFSVGMGRSVSPTARFSTTAPELSLNAAPPPIITTPSVRTQSPVTKRGRKRRSVTVESPNSSPPVSARPIRHK